MKGFVKTIPTYYRKIAWTQPTLTSNGSFGGNEMGVEAHALGSYSSAYNLDRPYAAFSSNAENLSLYGNEFRVTMYVNIYIPVSLVLTKISFTVKHLEAASGGVYNGCIWGDISKNSKTTALMAFNYVPDDNNNHSFETPNNIIPFQYYTFQVSAGGWVDEDLVTISNILLEGFTPQVSDELNYDYVINSYNCKLPKIDNRYYAVKG